MYHMTGTLLALQLLASQGALLQQRCPPRRSPPRSVSVRSAAPAAAPLSPPAPPAWAPPPRQAALLRWLAKAHDADLSRVSVGRSAYTAASAYSRRSRARRTSCSSRCPTARASASTTRSPTRCSARGCSRSSTPSARAARSWPSPRSSRSSCSSTARAARGGRTPVGALPRERRLLDRGERAQSYSGRSSSGCKSVGALLWERRLLDRSERAQSSSRRVISPGQCREQSSPGRPGTWEVLISRVPEGLFWLVFGWFWPVLANFRSFGGLGAHLDVRHWPLFAALPPCLSTLRRLLTPTPRLEKAAQ